MGTKWVPMNAKKDDSLINILHPYHFAIDEENAKNIMEVYDYEWTNEEI